MKFMLLLLATCYVVLAKPSLPVNPGGIGGLFKGPNSETIIKGPDGSIITSAAQGGEVKTKLDPIIVADIPTPAATATPLLIESASVISATARALEPGSVLTVTSSPATLVETVPVAATVSVALPAPKPVEAAVVDPPAVEPDQSSDLVGPSGRVSTKGSHAIIDGPASTTITAHAVKTAPAVPLAPSTILPVATASPILSLPDYSAVSLTAVPAIPLGATAFAGAPLSFETISTVTASPDSSLVSASPLPSGIASTSGSLAPIGPISTVQPASINGVLNVATVSSTAIPAIGSSTVPPPIEVSGYVSTTSSPLGPGVSSDVIPSLQPAIQSIQHLPSSTLAPPVVSTSLPNYLNRDLQPQLVAINHQPQLQLTVNPELIPRRNIVPPEIGIRQDVDGKLLFSPTPRPSLGNPSTAAPVVTSTLLPQYLPSSRVDNAQILSLPKAAGIQQDSPILLENHLPQGQLLTEDQLINIQNANIQEITNSKALEQGLLTNEVQSTKLTPAERYVEVTPKPAQIAGAQQQYLLTPQQQVIGVPHAPQYILAYPQSQQPQQDAGSLTSNIPNQQLLTQTGVELNQQQLLEIGNAGSSLSSNIQNQHLLSQAGVDLSQSLPTASAEPSYAVNVDFSDGLGRWERGLTKKESSR